MEYCLRLLCPARLYAYSTKVRIPAHLIDFRKLLVAKFVLGKGGSAIDGGAHIGYHTRYLSEVVGDKGKVHSFEPNPYIFSLLKKGVKNRENVQVYQKALSSINQRVPFYVRPYSLGQDSSLEKPQSPRKKVEVETISLDEFLPLDNVRLIKLDVEGHEFQAILGAKELIRRCRPWIIFEYVQTKERNDKAVISLLKEWGYRCFDLQECDWMPTTRQIELTDILAFPKADYNKTFIDSLSCY